MHTPKEIKDLAFLRLEEAVILYKSGKCDGAFYLAGYSVELMLKAKICERFGIPNLFDDEDKSSQISGISDIRKSLRTHNLFMLLIYSGLKVAFDTEKAKNKYLAKANSLLFNSWNENARYKPCGHVKNEDVSELLKLISDSANGLLKWIEQN